MSGILINNLLIDFEIKHLTNFHPVIKHPFDASSLSYKLCPYFSSFMFINLAIERLLQ